MLGKFCSCADCVDEQKGVLTYVIVKILSEFQFWTNQLNKPNNEMGNSLCSGNVEQHLRRQLAIQTNKWYETHTTLTDQITELTKKNSAYEQEEQNFVQTIQEKEVEITNLTQELHAERQKNQQITRRISTPEQEVQNFIKTIQEKELQITNLSQMLHSALQKNQEITSSQDVQNFIKTIQEKELQITNLSQMLHGEQQKNEQQNLLTTAARQQQSMDNFQMMQSQIKDLQNKIQILEEKNMELEINNQQLGAERIDQKNEVQELNEKIRNLLNMAKINVTERTYNANPQDTQMAASILNQNTQENIPDRGQSNTTVMTAHNTIGWRSNLTKNLDENKPMGGNDIPEAVATNFGVKIGGKQCENNLQQYKSLSKMFNKTDTTILDKMRYYRDEKDQITGEPSSSALKNAASIENLVELSKLQELHIKDSLQLINSVRDFTATLEKQVTEFFGDNKSTEYLHLEEMLIKNSLLLDRVESEGLEKIRQERKLALQYVQQCIEGLKNRANNTFNIINGNFPECDMI